MMKKKIIAAVIIIITLVSAVCAALFVNSNIKEKDNKEIELEKPEGSKKIPQLEAWFGNEKTGDITGYSLKMDTVILRDNLIAATADERKAKIKISDNGAKIKSASYEIRSNDGERLIDNGEIEEVEKDAFVEIPVSAILENSKEYLLTIVISTDELDEIYYYSRIMVVENDFITEQLNFAKEFSDSTLDRKKASMLVTYLEPDAELANNNLGKVTLANNYDVLTWAKLSPKKTTDTYIQLKEIYVKSTGVSGTYQMKYKVEAEGNNKISDTYDVVETITIWTYNSTQYVLAYEREVNQVWNIDENTVRNKFLDLGIQSDTTIDYKQSEDGEYITYAVNGQLWMMSISEKKFTKIYSTENDNAKIITSSVDNDGKANFIVCGYNMSGTHGGMNGISVCSYDIKENKVKELVFIPSNKPKDVLLGEIGKLCYINDDVLYLMIGNSIYYVNLKTKETGTAISGLVEGSYAINESKDSIAYNTNGSVYDSDSITVANLSDGTNKVIEAGNGYKIKVCGYSGNNIVYGTAPESQINIKKGRNIFNMSSLTILDKELKELTSYSKENIYITNVEITDSVINLKRIKNKNQIDDDQLLNNTEKSNAVVNVSYYDDTKKYRELALSLKNQLSNSAELKTAKSPKFVASSAVIEPEWNTSAQENYYVYAAGKLKGIFSDKDSAIVLGEECDGLVINASGEKIWSFEEDYN